MCISLKEFTDSSGHTSVVLKMDGSPLYWPNLYTTIHYRNPQKSPNTITKVLRTIGYCYLWAKSENIDFDQVLTTGNFLSIPNIDSLASFLRLSAISQQSLLTSASTSSRSRPRSLEGVRRNHSTKHQNISAYNFVNSIEAATRIRIAAAYLTFHLRRRTDGTSVSKDDAESVILYLKQLTPRIKPAIYNEELQGISDSETELLEFAFRPNSETNPFRPGFHQHRNYLIWRFLYETGMRRHELCGIKIQDVSYSEHRVVINESKTYARTVPISHSLTEHFHDFVIKYRSKVPAKNDNHGYLFTRENGQRLGLNSINLVFSSIMKKLPISSIELSVTPHTMRRTWNDRFSNRIDKLPDSERISPEKEHQMRIRLMGWSTKSEQAARYAKRHIRKKADDIAEKLANELVQREKNKDE